MWDGADEGCAPIQLGRSKPNGFGPQSDGEEEDDVPILFDPNYSGKLWRARSRKAGMNAAFLVTDLCNFQSY